MKTEVLIIGGGFAGPLGKAINELINEEIYNAIIVAKNQKPITNPYMTGVTDFYI